MFNSQLATSHKALDSLKKSYDNQWQGNYTLFTLFNLWFYKCTKNSNKVIVRAYYKYLDKNNNFGYWNAFFIYDVCSSTYTYKLSSGNYANCTYNGLEQKELHKLKVFYYNPEILAGNNILNDLSQIIN